MVTLGSMHPVFQQGFHEATGSYDDALNLRSLELPLNDVHGGDMVDSALGNADPAEERASPILSSKPARRGSIMIAAPPTAAPEVEAGTGTSEQRDQSDAPPTSSSRRGSVHTQSSAHRLFRAAPPEPKKQWNALPVGSDEAGSSVASGGGGDSRLRASSWHGSNQDHARSPRSADDNKGDAHSGSSRERFFPKKGRGRDDREILDGSDVLQQISNVTSTEPSNEREVFVGGLRESEDAVHITEEELATYFTKFGVIESVSINRDDRTQRGRGFAFVKFYNEASALNAVVADASTHVIRGTTVSVQWSRGAKDGGSSGDRPRRRNSASASTSSANGSSPSRGNGRSSSKSGMFPHKGSGGRGGGGSGPSNHGFSPMRGRSVGHMHTATGGGGVPYGFGGGRHGEHHNQAMVCVVVPAQRAAALGLAPHPAHRLHSTGTSSSKASPPRDTHFSPRAQQTSAALGGGGGHPGYPCHTRSHSQPGSVHGGGNGGGGGGYGHHGSSPHGSVDHHHGGMISPHHLSPSSGHHASPNSYLVSQNMSRSYGGAPLMHMPSMHRERRERTEPRDYSSTASGGNGAGPSYAEYERSQPPEPPLHSSSYVPPDWGYEDARGSRGGIATTHGLGRSQSPPTMVRSGSRNGGGAPRPPSASPRAYDGRYSSTRYSCNHGIDAFSVSGAGTASGGVATRRRSESSAMIGRSSMQQEAALAAASYYYSVDDMGKDDVGYGREYDLGYGPSFR